ncbi:MAG: RusA family crossover junction endodeoxyribonuclease [Pseudomonadota bacterium]
MKTGVFKGRGPVQAAFRDNVALVRVDAVTTQAGPLKKRISAALRREIGPMRPSYAPFEARIWTSVVAGTARAAYDVDNVAKACLDALTGVFWHDDRQVARLVSERFVGDRARILIRVRRLDAPLAPVALDGSLFDAD